MPSVPSGPSPASKPAAAPSWIARVAIYAALLVAFTAPVSLDPGARTFAPGPDTRLYLWTVGWDLHALKTDPFRIFDANIFFPETKTLAYSEHLIGAAALAWPLSLLTSNLALLLNFVLLSATLLTALGCDRLARECGASSRGALLAGILGAFSGPRLGRLTQAHLATLHFVPWALAFAIRYVQRRERRDLRITLALFTAQAVTSGHGGLFLALGLSLIFGAALVRKELSLPALVREAGLPGLVILAVNLPFVIPYYEVKQRVGLTRVLEDAAGYAPSMGAWIAAPTRTQEALLAAAPALQRLASAANASLFPGFVFAVLAVFGMALAVRDRASGVPARLMALVAVVSLWLTLGPSFGLYRLVYAVVPGFDLIRVPSRFFLLALPALAGLAALALDRIRDSRLAWVLVLAATFECVPVGWEAPRDAIVTPPVDAWLATQAKPFRVVELPVPRPDNSVRQARFHSEFMIHGAAHWQPMMNGYSSLVPPRLESLYADLYDFPTEKSVAALEALGVEYVLVHTDMYQPERWAERERALSDFAGRVRLLRVEGEGRAYGLVASRPQGVPHANAEQRESGR